MSEIGSEPGRTKADRVFLGDRSPLRPEQAVVAMIQPQEGRYLMQLRDSIEGIFFPGHWGFFGGAIEEGESDIEALRRELQEELSLTIEDRDATYFTRFDMDLTFAGYGKVRRDFYRVNIHPDVLPGLRLREGQAMEVWPRDRILCDLRVTPYDRWATWLHENQSRISAKASRGNNSTVFANVRR